MLLYILIKFHENILDGIKVIERTRFSNKEFQRALFRKNEGGVTVLFLCTSSNGGLYLYKSRKENPQKLTPLSSRSHPRHLVGKRTAQKDITKDTTSDSQVNSNFPNRWSPASLTFNNYFYLFLYLYIT